MAGPTLPVLWHFPISHYNEKVRWALDFKRIPHQRRALSIGYVPRALWATGQARLPILFLDGRPIADSTRIIAALEAHRPEPALYPADEAARRRALLLEDFFDEQLGAALRAVILGPLFEREPATAVAVLTTGMGAGARRAAASALPLFAAFYRRRHGINAASVEAGRAKVLAALDRLEAELQPSGYLVGDRFTVADLTAAALLSPLVLPPEFPYPPSGPLPASMAAYRDSLLDRPACRWVLETYRRHRGRSAEVGAAARAA
jgi:glutathione S-transferase